MNNQKNTIYLVVFLIFILLALVGWFIIRRQANTPLAPSMPHGTDSGFSQVKEKPQAPTTDTTSPITILAPVPEGDPADHSDRGWKKIKGTVPVVVQTSDVVSRLVFYLDRDSIGEVTGPPFDFELDTTKYAGYMYLLRAKAYDAEGNELGEDRSQVWIVNTP